MADRRRQMVAESRRPRRRSDCAYWVTGSCRSLANIHALSRIMFGMESQLVITYEVIEPVSNKSFVTKNRYEALDYYEKNYIVYETHTTIARLSEFNQARLHAARLWNDNPEFEEELQNENNFD